MCSVTQSVLLVYSIYKSARPIFIQYLKLSYTNGQVMPNNGIQPLLLYLHLINSMHVLHVRKKMTHLRFTKLWDIYRHHLIICYQTVVDGPCRWIKNIKFHVMQHRFLYDTYNILIPVLDDWTFDIYLICSIISVRQNVSENLYMVKHHFVIKSHCCNLTPKNVGMLGGFDDSSQLRRILIHKTSYLLQLSVF